MSAQIYRLRTVGNRVSPPAKTGSIHTAKTVRSAYLGLFAYLLVVAISLVFVALKK